MNKPKAGRKTKMAIFHILVWDMGCIYLQTRYKTNAADCFKSALNVYNIVWENEPELLRAKVEELRKMAAMFKMSDLLMIQ